MIILFEEQRNLFYKWIEKQKCKIIQKCKTITPNDIEQIESKRQFIHNEYHPICWIARFKDVMMNNIQQQKPEIFIIIIVISSITIVD